MARAAELAEDVAKVAQKLPGPSQLRVKAEVAAKMDEVSDGARSVNDCVSRGKPDIQGGCR